MNIMHRLAALSVSSVVLAACSGGGTASLMRPATNAAVSASTHAANAVLSIKFPTNAVRVGSSSQRSPKFVDPIGGKSFDVEVTDPSGNSYMAVKDLIVASNATGQQTLQIPLFLAPSGFYTDTILVQEYTGPVFSVAGYLMAAQGSATVSVGEGVNITPPTIQMQMVIQPPNNGSGAGNLIPVSNLSSFTPITEVGTGTGFTTTGGVNYACLSSVGTAPIYFVPVDVNGVTTFTAGTTPGTGGLPQPQITSASVNPGTTTLNTGTSKLVPTDFGGYTAYIDGASDDISVTATYGSTNPVLVDPQGALSAPFSTLVTQATTTGQVIEYFSIRAGC